MKGWGLEDDSNVNVNGSGISLGHPIGATGARIMTSLLHEMARRDARYGLETMCVGGGQRWGSNRRDFRTRGVTLIRSIQPSSESSVGDLPDLRGFTVAGWNFLPHKTD